MPRATRSNKKTPPTRAAKDFIAQVRAAEAGHPVSGLYTKDNNYGNGLAEQEECDAKCAASLQSQCGTTETAPYNQIHLMQDTILRLEQKIKNQEAELLGLYRAVANKYN